MCNLNRELYLELLLKFRETKRTDAEDIRSALASGDRTTARRLAHSMKSVAGILGATNLSVTANLLEEAIAKDLDSHIADRLKNYSQSLELIFVGLDTLPDMAEEQTDAH
jgi:HPt (histidine-containing phosphotransfer) domain-containing protein